MDGKIFTMQALIKRKLGLRWEGRGQGTGGVPYQTPWYLPERHLPEADVHTKYLMSG